MRKAYYYFCGIPMPAVGTKHAFNEYSWAAALQFQRPRKRTKMAWNPIRALFPNRN